ncbi:receptor-type tyrosine-protein phosphatase C-like [Channa argus]|uniref:receptor-type tyrosine-protein phosphatase C-like n=1 Tax=Channa argus TaxID=215402 RepID=UPI00351FBCC7
MYYYILQYLLDMAGLCNVKTLLLLAWIICQINTTAWGKDKNAASNSPSTISPSTTSASSNHSPILPAISSPALTSNETSTTTSNETDHQRISPSPATTQLNSTVTFTTEDSPTSVPLTITSSTSPLVTNKSVTTLLPSTMAATSAVSSNTQTTTQTPEPPSSTLTTDSTKETKHSDAMSVTSITPTRSTQCTGDIQVNNCRPGYVCYQSDWDISFSLSSSNHVSSERCTSDDKTLCIKLGNKDYCSDLTTTFTSGSCSLSLTTSITVDYINPSDIFQPVPTKLPAQIVPEFPINCRSLSIDYTCLDELNKPKKLTDLEPFTDYNCTGQIKNNNVNTNKATTVRFRVDCDLTINTKNRQTNTSIELSWDTTSQKCPDVPELKNLNYTCSCTDSTQKGPITADKHPSGGTCHFTGLQPFTSYTCKVQPTYNNKDVSETKEVTVETEPGIPEVITQLTVKVPGNNMITVECEPHSSLSFKGPQERYIARLQYGSETPVVKNETKCQFEFKHLSYSTTYKLEVTAFNGKFESRSRAVDVDTLYNDKAVIVLIIFVIIIIISLPVVFYIIKIYRRCKQSTDDVYENIRTETIYINARPPESHQKGTNL